MESLDIYDYWASMTRRECADEVVIRTCWAAPSPWLRRHEWHWAPQTPAAEDSATLGPRAEVRACAPCDLPHRANVTTIDAAAMCYATTTVSVCMSAGAWADIDPGTNLPRGWVPVGWAPRPVLQGRPRTAPAPQADRFTLQGRKPLKIN